MGFNLANNNVVEVTTFGVCEEQAVNNVWWFRIKSNGTSAFPIIGGSTNLLERMQSLQQTVLMAHLSEDFAIMLYRARLLDESAGAHAKVEFLNQDELVGDVALDVGGAVGPSFPTYVTANASMRTGVTGRSKRGRKGFGVIPLTSQDTTGEVENRLSAAEQAALQTDLDLNFLEFTVGSSTTGFKADIGVFSKKLYLPNVASYFTPLSGWRVQRHFGTQNSRKQRNTPI